MHIFGITSTTFTSGSYQAVSAAQSPKRDMQIAVKSAKDELYENISGFMNNKYDKNEYIHNFVESVNRIDNFSEFNKIERDYISNLVMTLDSAENYDDIPDGYLKWLMNNLLEMKDFT